MLVFHFISFCSRVANRDSNFGVGGNNPRLAVGKFIIGKLRPISLIGKETKLVLLFFISIPPSITIRYII